MHDDVRAQFDRARQQRRRRGRVDRDGRTDLAGDRARRGNIGNLPGRVGGRLDPNQPRPPRASFFCEIVGRRIVVELDRQPPRHGDLEQPFAQRPVHVLRRECASAGRERLEDGRRGGLARGEQHRRGGTFQRRDQRLGLIVAGVIGTRINTSSRKSAVRAALVGGRDVNRRNDVAIRSRDLAHSLGGERFRMQSRFVGCHR